jgi:glycosyltransferase involved in cell wall biosynthesis
MDGPQLTDHFHAVSHAVNDSAVHALGIDVNRVTVVERGRDPGCLGEPSPERRARVRAAFGIDQNARVIVTVGRQEFQKGHVYLVSAFDVIAQSRPDTELLLVGRAGNQSAAVESRDRRLPYRDRIRTLGHRDDVPDLLAACDVLVLPSLYEGFPGVVIEAMGLALPVVASSIPTLREVVDEETGILVPPRDVERLVEAVGRVLDDEKLALGKGGRERFLTRGSPPSRATGE